MYFPSAAVYTSSSNYLTVASISTTASLLISPLPPSTSVSVLHYRNLGLMFIGLFQLCDQDLSNSPMGWDYSQEAWGMGSTKCPPLWLYTYWQTLG
eukprot:15366937-Ditylum_brightwellii.AAC.1